jgi:Sec-independent protein translocase protein TatA
MPTDLLLVLIVILVLALLWKGPKNLPRIGEALGRGIREARTEATKGPEEGQTKAGSPDDPPRPGADQPS